MSAEAGTAIAIRDGVIAAVGTAAAMTPLTGPDTRVLSYPGATITPGLSDAHSHPVLGAELAVGVDLTAVRSLPELRESLVATRKGLRPGEWLRGWGLDPNAWGRDRVTSAILNEVCGSVPAVLRMFDAHSALVSQAALDLAGIVGPREFTTGSRVDVDDKGNPTGLLLESDAMDLVLQLLPEEPIEERAGHLQSALSAMAASGLTSVQAMDFQGEPFDVLRHIEAEADLPLRLRIAPWIEPKHSPSDWERILDWQGTGGRRWSIHGVKFFLDGTIDSGTAWLQRPDTQGQSIQSTWSDPSAYAAAVGFFAANGVGTATHAIGDAAIRLALETIAGLPPAGPAGPVHRVEHVETLPNALLDAFASSGAVASMQPTHCTHFVRPDLTDNWSMRLGRERAKDAWRTRSLLLSGVPLALGSDWPVAPFDPRAIMADAQLRREAGRPDLRPTGPEEGLTALEALAGFTTGPAYAAGLAGSEGSIEPGRVADLTVFASDPLTVSPEQLAQMPILATIVDGVVQFEADS
jgi:hypothetical protein